MMFPGDDLFIVFVVVIVFIAGMLFLSKDTKRVKQRMTHNLWSTQSTLQKGVKAVEKEMKSLKGDVDGMA